MRDVELVFEGQRLTPPDPKRIVGWIGKLSAERLVLLLHATPAADLAKGADYVTAIVQRAQQNGHHAPRPRGRLSPDDAAQYDELSKLPLAAGAEDRE